MIKIDEDLEKKLETILQHYGPESQLHKTVEECCKLITAIVNPNSSLNNCDSLVEEIADCLVLLLQLRDWASEDLVDNIIKTKVDRTLNRIKESKIVSTRNKKRVRLRDAKK